MDFTNENAIGTPDATRCQLRKCQPVITEYIVPSLCFEKAEHGEKYSQRITELRMISEYEDTPRTGADCSKS
jgi:hypothetical protein